MFTDALSLLEHCLDKSPCLVFSASLVLGSAGLHSRLMATSALCTAAHTSQLLGTLTSYLYSLSRLITYFSLSTEDSFLLANKACYNISCLGSKLSLNTSPFRYCPSFYSLLQQNSLKELPIFTASISPPIDPSTCTTQTLLPNTPVKTMFVKVNSISILPNPQRP